MIKSYDAIEKEMLDILNGRTEFDTDEDGTVKCPHCKRATSFYVKLEDAQETEQGVSWFAILCIILLCITFWPVAIFFLLVAIFGKKTIIPATPDNTKTKIKKAYCKLCNRQVSDEQPS